MWTSLPNVKSHPTLSFFVPYPDDLALLLLSADCFNSKDWSLDAAGLSVSNPELAFLSTDLHDAALVCRAAGTFRTYSGPWKHFKRWCLQKGVSALPAKPLTVALYMMRLLHTAKTPSPLLTFSGAVFFNHSLAGLPSPTSHPLVAMAREAARHIRVAGLNQKRPFLASHIRHLFGLWGGPSATLHQLMKLTAVVIATSLSSALTMLSLFLCKASSLSINLTWSCSFRVAKQISTIPGRLF
jgi:hypothetical protein